MGHYRTAALVLRSRKYLEADSLLTLFTEKKGKLTAIAKGVRKPSSRLRGGTLVFTHNDMLLAEGRNLDIVTQSQCLEAFATLQENMTAIAAASYWSELLDALTPEREVDPLQFQLALAGYHILCLDASELVVKALEMKLLSLLGYRPQLGKCVSCGRTVAGEIKISFSLSLGGVTCAACNPGDAIFCSPEALAVWQQLLRLDLSKLKRLKITPQGMAILDRVMEEFLLRQLDYPLKSRPVLKEIMREGQA